MRAVKDKLEQDLGIYNKLILVDSAFDRAEEALSVLKDCMDVHVYSCIKPLVCAENIEMIDSEIEKCLLKLYYLYEFSNRFVVINENKQFGNVWSYVNADLITFEDAVRCYL